MDGTRSDCHSQSMSCPDPKEREGGPAQPTRGEGDVCGGPDHGDHQHTLLPLQYSKAPPTLTIDSVSPGARGPASAPVSSMLDPSGGVSEHDQRPVDIEREFDSPAARICEYLLPLTAWVAQAWQPGEDAEILGLGEKAKSTSLGLATSGAVACEYWKRLHERVCDAKPQDATPAVESTVELPLSVVSASASSSAARGTPVSFVDRGTADAAAADATHNTAVSRNSSAAAQKVAKKPKPDYKCAVCGVVGEHIVRQCPVKEEDDRRKKQQQRDQAEKNKAEKMKRKGESTKSKVKKNGATAKKQLERAYRNIFTDSTAKDHHRHLQSTEAMQTFLSDGRIYIHTIPTVNAKVAARAVADEIERFAFMVAEFIKNHPQGDGNDDDLRTVDVIRKTGTIFRADATDDEVFLEMPAREGIDARFAVVADIELRSYLFCGDAASDHLVGVAQLMNSEIQPDTKGNDDKRRPFDGRPALPESDDPTDQKCQCRKSCGEVLDTRELRGKHERGTCKAPKAPLGSVLVHCLRNHLRAPAKDRRSVQHSVPFLDTIRVAAAEYEKRTAALLKHPYFEDHVTFVGHARHEDVADTILSEAGDSRNKLMELAKLFNDGHDSKQSSTAATLGEHDYYRLALGSADPNEFWKNIGGILERLASAPVDSPEGIDPGSQATALLINWLCSQHYLAELCKHAEKALGRANWWLRTTDESLVAALAPLLEARDHCGACTLEKATLEALSGNKIAYDIAAKRLQTMSVFEFLANRIHGAMLLRNTCTDSIWFCASRPNKRKSHTHRVSADLENWTQPLAARLASTLSDKSESEADWKRLREPACLPGELDKTDVERLLRVYASSPSPDHPAIGRPQPKDPSITVISVNVDTDDDSDGTIPLRRFAVTLRQVPRRCQPGNPEGRYTLWPDYDHDHNEHGEFELFIGLTADAVGPFPSLAALVQFLVECSTVDGDTTVLPNVSAKMVCEQLGVRALHVPPEVAENARHGRPPLLDEPRAALAGVAPYRAPGPPASTESPPVPWFWAVTERAAKEALENLPSGAFRLHPLAQHFGPYLRAFNRWLPLRPRGSSKPARKEHRLRQIQCLGQIAAALKRKSTASKRSFRVRYLNAKQSDDGAVLTLWRRHQDRIRVGRLLEEHAAWRAAQELAADHGAVSPGRYSHGSRESSRGSQHSPSLTSAASSPSLSSGLLSPDADRTASALSYKGSVEDTLPPPMQLTPATTHISFGELLRCTKEVFVLRRVKDRLRQYLQWHYAIRRISPEGHVWDEVRFKSKDAKDFLSLDPSQNIPGVDLLQAALREDQAKAESPGSTWTIGPGSWTFKFLMEKDSDAIDSCKKSLEDILHRMAEKFEASAVDFKAKQVILSAQPKANRCREQSDGMEPLPHFVEGYRGSPLPRTWECFESTPTTAFLRPLIQTSPESADADRILSDLGEEIKSRGQPGLDVLRAIQAAVTPESLKIRIFTWNILAEMLSTGQLDSVPWDELSWSTRWPRVQLELENMTKEAAGSVICLQEVQQSNCPLLNHRAQIQSFMESRGFQCVYGAEDERGANATMMELVRAQCEKRGEDGRLLERVDGVEPIAKIRYCKGVMLCWDTSIFTLAKCDNPTVVLPFKDTYKGAVQCAVIAALEHKSTKQHIIVSTMHPPVPTALDPPSADVVLNLLCGYFLTGALGTLRQRVRDQLAQPAGIIVCGDLNCVANQPLCMFLKHSSFDPRTLSTVCVEGKDTSIFEECGLPQNEKIGNVLGGLDHASRPGKAPAFNTVVSESFSECIDHVFYQMPHGSLSAFLGPPPDEVARIEYPNEHVPSDHLWTGAEFELTPRIDGHPMERGNSAHT